MLARVHSGGSRGPHALSSPQSAPRLRCLLLPAAVLLLSCWLATSTVSATTAAATAAHFDFASLSSPSSAAVSVVAQLDTDGSVWLSGRRYSPTASPLPATTAADTEPSSGATFSSAGVGSGGSEADSDGECVPALIPPSSGTFWVYVAACLSLVLCGGLVSGLTIGLFSLSNLELEVLQEDCEADAADRHRAKRLKPLLKEERHHLLLVTLLLTNTAAMEALPEMLDKLVPEWAAVLISVSLVLLFSEIIPQSICTRAPLAVGAFFSPLVWLLMLVLFPVSWPIAKVLDLCIGKGLPHIQTHSHAGSGALASQSLPARPNRTTHRLLDHCMTGGARRAHLRTAVCAQATRLTTAAAAPATPRVCV